MKLIFLGPPGVGKGTVAKAIDKKFDIIQISTGDLLRKSVNEKTELGKKAKEYMERGELVPDELISDLIKERIGKSDCSNGFALDGFPRTIAQAHILEDHGINVDVIIHFKASENTIIDRISGRRTCKDSNTIYHIKNMPPKKEGVCDICGGELYQRDDDKPHAVRKRLRVYDEHTAPLIDYYKKKGMLVDIDTEKPLAKIIEETIEAIGK